ncbi:unnamed protein product, partial [Didymodactylos carnosus]
MRNALHRNTRQNINDSGPIKTHTLIRAGHSVEYQSSATDRTGNKD